MKDLAQNFLLRLKHRPRWLTMFLLLNITLAGVELAMDPVVGEATFARLPPGARAEDRVVLREMLDSQLPLRVAFLPVRNIAGWGLFALCLYYMALAFRPLGPVRFVQVFALEVWAETALTLGSMATVLREWIVPGSPEQFANAPPFSLLGLLESSGSIGVDTLMGAVTPFALIYLAVLATGMALLCGFRSGRALLVVLGVWGGTLLLNAAALTALKDLLHLAV